MKIKVILIGIVCLLFASFAFALNEKPNKSSKQIPSTQYGRFQLIILNSDTPILYLIDTETGNIWTDYMSIPTAMHQIMIEDINVKSSDFNRVIESAKTGKPLTEPVPFQWETPEPYTGITPKEDEQIRLRKNIKKDGK